MANRFARVVDRSRGEAMSLLGLSMSAIGGAKTQGALVDALCRGGALRTATAEEALRRVDRALFIPLQQDAAIYAEPYESKPVQLDAASKSTLSTPHHHCTVCDPVAEFLSDKLRQPSAPRLLDIGCGTGYLTAVFAEMLVLEGLRSSSSRSSSSSSSNLSGAAQVVGLDTVPSLVDAATDVANDKLRSEIRDLVHFEHAFSQDGEPTVAAMAQRGEAFDVVHAGFAIPEQASLLDTLLGPLLRNGGRFVGAVIPDADGPQELVVVDKHVDDGTLTKTVLMRQVHCQAMMDTTFDAEEASLTVADRLEQVKLDLEAWKADWERANGRPPSKTELLTDPTAKELFKAFADLRKRVWDA